MTLYGRVEDPGYFATAVAPLLGPDVRYGGHPAAADLAPAHGRASVFAFTPCWDESFGLVAIEAMACGVPIVAFDCGAALEIVGDAGIIVPAGEVGALAGAPHRAAAISCDTVRARARRQLQP